MRVNVSLARSFVAAAIGLLANVADASMGVTEIAGADGDGPVTVYYPSSVDARALKRGPFTLQLAPDGAPTRGNGRLVVISHGSGGSPWVHSDLARALVDAGFVVAMPEHRADNFKDTSAPGPESWKRRPHEVSRAIDAVGRDSRFKPLLALDKVGMFGMSAGGHTALSLAGGRWSPGRFTQHCEAHIADDFQACVGLATRLTGGMFDGPKKTLALWVIRSRFPDATWVSHTDARIVAVVASVPYAADFDTASLASPRVPLAIASARQDKWLLPRFHGDRILQACASCDRIADFPHGGHGAYLSPLPPNLSGLLGDLLNDPPGFDRGEIPEINRKISAFFRKYLLS
jgi:predicted dienelactone hydrolase